MSERRRAVRGVNLSPALVAVRAILGLHTALVVWAGGCVTWALLLPLQAAVIGLPPGGATVAAKQLWSEQLRYAGIGAMVVGGVWTIGQLRAPVRNSLDRVFGRGRTNQATAGAPRTEQDASAVWLLSLAIIALAAMAIVYARVVDSIVIAVFMTLVMGGCAFLFSSVAGYMAGLVGSSSNPVS